MIGAIGWAVILGVILAWEGVALVARTPDWPTLSDLMRVATRPLLGRWVMFAIWLWFGWHLFVRGWLFFLRDAPRPPSESAKTGPNDSAALVAPAAAEPLLGEEAITLLGFYVVVLALLTYCGMRIRKQGRAAYESSPQFAGRWGGRHAAAQVGATVFAGYGLFVVAMAVYFIAIARQPAAALVRAATEALSLTLLVAVPGFVVLAILYRLRSSRRDRFG